MQRRVEPEILEVRHREKPPRVCPKPGCKGTVFIQHPDGWQCFNCMKVIYQDQPILAIVLNSHDSGAL